MGESLSWLDVPGIVANSLWIVGLAVLLATWSWASYEASTMNQKVTARLDTFPNTLWLDAGQGLFAAGLLATEHRWWARIVWGGWLLWMIGQGVWHWRNRGTDVDGHS